MITEDEVFKAVEYLRESALKTAQARANMDYVESYKSVVKAQIMREHLGDPVNSQEREAYADPRYKQHLEAIKEAAEKFDYLRFMREAAQAKISFFQTYSANTRLK